MNSQRLTKCFLWLFIASIVATALAGIAAIAGPGLNGWFEFKILLTTAIIAAASVCGLACGGCLTRGHRVLPTAGLILAILSACLLLSGLWVEIDSEAYWKTAASLSFFAVACAHLAMLFMANLAGGYRWAYMVAHQLILGLAALLTAGFVFEEQLLNSEAFWRFTGVLAILGAAITLLIPVFHRLSRDTIAAERAGIDPVLVLDEEIAAVERRLAELENKRRALLERAEIET
jgi:hypothetical protein